MSVTPYPTLRLKLTMPQALKLHFMPALPGTNALNGKVNRAGDTMTGPLILYANPAAPLEAATKDYVDNHSGNPAPVDAEYVVSVANATLTNERVVTDTATVTWDRTTPGQIKANAAAGGGGNVISVPTPVLDNIAQWTDATHIKGVTLASLRVNALFTGTFTINGTPIDFLGTSGAGNGYRITPAASPNSPQFAAVGVDANIAASISAKGEQGVVFYSNNFGKPLLAAVNPGAGIASDTYLNVIPGVGRCQLFPNVAGRPIDITGVGSALAAVTGCIGELLTAAGAPTVCPANVATAVVTIPVPAGDWDLWASVTSGPGGTTASAYILGNLNPTPNAAGGGIMYGSNYASPAGDVLFALMPIPLRLNALTNYYVNVLSVPGATVIGTYYLRRRR
jgi:hypothetical protein